MQRSSYLIITLIVISLLSLFFSLALGDVSMPLHQILLTLFGHGSSLDSAIIFKLRLPRTFSAYATGGLLALAGCQLQVLLRNPLADPYILGVSGGAAFMSMVMMLLGIGGIWLTMGAFMGALLSMLLVFGLARGYGQWSAIRLLLIGIIIASGWAALLSLILTISPNRLLHGMLFWLMGDLSYATHPYFALVILAIGLLISFCWSKQLNILMHGEFQAQGLGVNTKRLTIQLYFMSALLTAVAVSLAGTIGFIGLIVPHMVRMISGSDHRIVIPASVLLGGSLLTLADMLARTVIAPQQLPVGIITALIGVPMFLYLLARGYRQWQ